MKQTLLLPPLFLFPQIFGTAERLGDQVNEVSWGAF
jgi:hypothetical protein